MSKRARQDFIQDHPDLKNPFDEDLLMQEFLSSKFQGEELKNTFEELKHFGRQVISEVHPLGRMAECHPPIHRPFSAWGERIDEIDVHPSWDQLKDFSARQHLVGAAYERRRGSHSRLIQFLKLYMFHPSSAFYTCPLAMADGAARVLELNPSCDNFRKAFQHLTTNDPKKSWVSGQWMTEKTGGSDVSDTSTVARSIDNEFFGLYGIKWFSSATTSEMALALARIEGDQDGSRGLSLFFVPMRNERNALNNILVHRLKDKLGTKALPTAELELCGAKAQLVGKPGEGVKKVASMLNITRMYNSICSVGTLRRAFNLARSFGEKREAFGSRLLDQPLFFQTLAKQSLDLAGHCLMTWELAHLMGKDETNEASDEERDLLRLLTPICKMMTAKGSIAGTSEMLECFGGAGYIEDTEIPVLYRDSQVFPIWEGATNVLSLDVLRVIEKTQALQSLKSYFSNLPMRQQDQGVAKVWNQRLDKLFLEIEKLKESSRESWVQKSRTLAFEIGTLYQWGLTLHLGETTSKKSCLAQLLPLWPQIRPAVWEFDLNLSDKNMSISV